MSGFAKLSLLVFSMSVAFVNTSMACGAIDGKGYRCVLQVVGSSDEAGEELFFYFKDKEVYRAFIDAGQKPAQLQTEKLGAYLFTSGGITWPGGYNLDKEELLLSVAGASDASYFCTLMASPLVEILAYFEPRIDELNSSGGQSE